MEGIYLKIFKADLCSPFFIYKKALLFWAIPSDIIFKILSSVFSYNSL